jgi:hypothetical protein
MVVDLAAMISHGGAQRVIDNAAPPDVGLTGRVKSGRCKSDVTALAHALSRKAGGSSRFCSTPIASHPTRCRGGCQRARAQQPS